mmetsp:Transcript_33673/g.81408  ORF Transcript_33673/g.81408 Transcript_33673/m.81408 type:complete len:300 (-) Transcript_33673:224-1123(-)
MHESPTTPASSLEPPGIRATAEIDASKSNADGSYIFPLFLPVIKKCNRSNGVSKHHWDLLNLFSFCSRKNVHNNPCHAGMAAIGAESSRTNHDAIIPMGFFPGLLPSSDLPRALREDPPPLTRCRAPKSPERALLGRRSPASTAAAIARSSSLPPLTLMGFPSYLTISENMELDMLSESSSKINPKMTARRNASVCSQRGDASIILSSSSIMLHSFPSSSFNFDWSSRLLMMLGTLACCCITVGPKMGGPSINPIAPLLHMRRSSRDAARSDANVANMNDRADAMLSIVGNTAILILSR